MSDGPHVLVAELDASGRVAGDVLCLTCGYNLRSLPGDGRCPECGAAVANSLHGYYLRFAQPEWVGRLARGATLILVAIGLTIVGWTVVVCLGLAAATGIASAAPAGRATMVQNPPHAVYLVLTIAFMLASLAAMLSGLLFYSSPDPVPSQPSEGLTARRLIRLCLWFLPVVFLLSIAGPLVQGIFRALQRPTPVPTIIAITLINTILAAAAGLVLPPALLRHTGWLMRRVPRPGLERFARILFWSWFAIGVLVLGGTVFYVVTIFSLMPTFAPTTMPASGLAALGYTGAGPYGGVTPATAAQLSALGYPVPAPASAPAGALPYGGSVTVRTTTGGQVIMYSGTSTMPATTMAAPPFPGGMIRRVLLGSLMLGGSGCGALCLVAAACVLLIMVRNALAAAARESRAIHASPAQPPSMQSTNG